MELVGDCFHIRPVTMGCYPGIGGRERRAEARKVVKRGKDKMAETGPAQGFKGGVELRARAMFGEGGFTVRPSSFRRRPESMERLHHLHAWTPASAGVTVGILHTLAVATDTLPQLGKT